LLLKDFARILMEDLGATRAVSGDGSREVKGISVEEALEGWLAPSEAAVVSRDAMDEDFLEEMVEGGCPAIVRRSAEEFPAAVVKTASKLKVGLYTIPPDVPLRRLLSMFAGESGLLLLSHGAGRALFESLGGESSIESLMDRISSLLGRQIVLEDPVGRLSTGTLSEASGDEDSLAQKSPSLESLLEDYDLRASRSAGVEETRRERRDRYARLPDGFLSVPVERWRVEEVELFWTPIGTGAPAGYLWLDLRDKPLAPEDVVLLYWARRALEAELDKQRIRLETELGMRGDFVDDLVNGHYGSVDLLLQRARYLGADLSRGAIAVIVDIDSFARYLERRRLKESAIQELKRRLADAARLQTRQLFSNFLLGPRSDNVIIFVGTSPDEDKTLVVENSRALADRLQRYVKGLLPDLTVSVGIGRYKGDPSAIPSSFSEAEVALEIGHRIHGPSSISTFEGTGTYKLLFRVLQEDPAELESFYGETLEPAVAYDSRYGTELVNTLITYLQNDASTVKTASDLFAHRHTIRYRLDRVNELTGLDVDKSEARERLTLGIKAMQLLGRSPETPPTFSDK